MADKKQKKQAERSTAQGVVTRVQVHDEPTRQALLYALWERASHEIGENFYDALGVEAWSALEADNGDREFAVVGDAIVLLRSTLSGVEQVKAAKVGDWVDLDTPSEVLADRLDSCALWIAGDERVWQLPRPERDRKMACHDSARRLASELAPAEAVA
jgi:hypothetical protein